MTASHARWKVVQTTQQGQPEALVTSDSVSPSLITGTVTLDLLRVQYFLRHQHARQVGHRLRVRARVGVRIKVGVRIRVEVWVMVSLYPGYSGT